MERDERALWNQKYSEGSHSSLNLDLEPDPFLVRAYSEFLTGCKPGRALDVAGGVGRHAIWLAERGWNVKLVDVSEAGIELARKNLAQLKGAPLKGAPRASVVEFEAVDLEKVHDLGHEQYDLVLVFLYLQRSLFPALTAALRPGGFLVYMTYTLEQQRFPGGPHNPVYLLEPNELLHAFASLRVLHYHETVRNKGTAELVAQKINR